MQHEQRRSSTARSRPHTFAMRRPGVRIPAAPPPKNPAPPAQTLDCGRGFVGAGIASLGFWGGFAGHRAGLTGLRLVLCVAGGLGLGALTLLLAAILQPGTKPFAP
jgi:hypothetical protein